MGKLGRWSKIFLLVIIGHVGKICLKKYVFSIFTKFDVCLSNFVIKVVSYQDKIFVTPYSPLAQSILSGKSILSILSQKMDQNSYVNKKKNSRYKSLLCCFFAVWIFRFNFPCNGGVRTNLSELKGQTVTISVSLIAFIIYLSLYIYMKFCQTNLIGHRLDLKFA